MNTPLDPVDAQAAKMLSKRLPELPCEGIADFFISRRQKPWALIRGLRKAIHEELGNAGVKRLFDRAIQLANHKQDKALDRKIQQRRDLNNVHI